MSPYYMETIHIIYEFETPNKMDFRQIHTYDQTILPEMGAEVSFEADVKFVKEAYGTNGPFVVTSRAYVVSAKGISTAILGLKLKSDS